MTRRTFRIRKPAYLRRPRDRPPRSSWPFSSRFPTWTFAGATDVTWPGTGLSPSPGSPSARSSCIPGTWDLVWYALKKSAKRNVTTFELFNFYQSRGPVRNPYENKKINKSHHSESQRRTQRFRAFIRDKEFFLFWHNQNRISSQFQIVINIIQIIY